MGLYIANEQKYMYRSEDEPPKMKLNDYIVRYKQTGNNQYLQYFLHKYEPALNKRAMEYCEHYGLLNYFEDIKQTIVTVLLMQIEKCDPSSGASLITFTDLHVKEAVCNFVRHNCGILTPSEYDYDNLRRVMAVYNENSNATAAERVQAVLVETGLKEGDIRLHLQRGDMFLYSESFDDEHSDDEDYVPLVERIGDIRSNPEYIVLKKILYAAITTTVDKLPYKENRVILSYCGLERLGDWFEEVEPLSKEELAAYLHVGKAQAVDDNFRRALKALRTELEKQGWLEGEHTRKSFESTDKESQELTDFDYAVIDYAVRKWQKSGKSAEFHMLYIDKTVNGGKLILEFLKLWLY